MAPAVEATVALIAVVAIAGLLMWWIHWCIDRLPPKRGIVIMATPIVTALWLAMYWTIKTRTGL